MRKIGNSDDFLTRG